jgi:hypothetical protein
MDAGKFHQENWGREGPSTAVVFDGVKHGQSEPAQGVYICA